jgi:hypothetical protein
MDARQADGAVLSPLVRYSREEWSGCAAPPRSPCRRAKRGSCSRLSSTSPWERRLEHP